MRISKAKIWVPRPPWSTEHLNMHERRLSLLDTDRSQKIDNSRKICPNAEAGRPAHRRADYWFFFSLRKGLHLFFFLFFSHTSAAALYLLNLTSVKQSRTVGTTIFLRRSYTTPMALESSRLAELKYAISEAWYVKKITAVNRAHLNETFPRLKSVLP